MTLLVIYIASALVISFLCSILEAVMLSITPSYLAGLEEARPKKGKRLRGLKANIERPLAAILSLNTIAHTVGAAGAGAQALKIYGSEYVAVISAILTLLILVISEIIPKTLGATYWKRLAPLAADVLQPLIVLMAPLVLLAQGLARVLTPRKIEPSVSRQELHALADVVEREGTVAQYESRVLRSMLRFRSVLGQDIMTPRSVVVAFPNSFSVAEAVKDEADLAYSRFPVYAESLDAVTGYVLKHDLLLHMAAGDTETKLGALERDVLTNSEATPLPALLDAMLEQREHMIVLSAEKGGTAGIVTLEDVVESLTGIEIVDETDIEDDMRVLARRQSTQRAQNPRR